MRANIRFLGDSKLYSIANAPDVEAIIRDIKAGDILDISGFGKHEVFTTYDPNHSIYGGFEIVIQKLSLGVK